MYLDFFGLSEKPFNVTPDPRFLYLTPGHREALASMIYGIRERMGIVCLIGEVGTGKTTLLYKLIELLDEDIRAAYIFNSKVTFKELLKSTFSQFGLPCERKSSFTLFEELGRFLSKQMLHGIIVALIIDEAQNLTPSVLEHIRLMSNMETPKQKLLQILLVGQPELGEKLRGRKLRQLRQRITSLRVINPLGEEDTRDYILHRLKVAGANSPNIFSSNAVGRMFQHSRGVPRLINTLCDNAMLIGCATDTRRIEEAIIDEAIADLEIPTLMNED